VRSWHTTLDRLLDKYIAVKVLSDRVSWYITKASTLMVVYLFFDRVGWSWWLLLFIPVLIGLVELERKKLVQKEQAYYLRHNPELIAMFKHTKHDA
jgi:hypothetical protein